MVACVACRQPEIAKMPNGTFYEPKADLIKKKKSIKEVKGRLCGICTQLFMFEKKPSIPWDGVVMSEEIKSNKARPSRRRPRRRPSRRRRRK